MADAQPTALTSLEVPTMVSDGTGAASVMAIIEHLSAAECRMRSVHGFTMGGHVEFNVSIHGAPTIPLRGKIVASKQNGARHAYVVALQSTGAQTEAIAKANDAARARAATHGPDIRADAGLTRESVRVPVDFELKYTQLGANARSARAINISTGGVHMNTTDTIAVGAAIEMEIPLGSQSLHVRGRIVAHQEMSPNYNIAFYEITHEARENLARFIESKASAA
jgi:PilZ domain